MKEAHTRPETSKKQPQDRGHHEPPCPPGGGEALSVWPAASQLPQRGSQDADLTAAALASPFGGGGIRAADDGEGKRSLARCGGDGNFWTRAVPAVWPKDLTWMLLPRSLQKRRAIMDK